MWLIVLALLSTHDFAMFLKNISDHQTILLLYVVDMIITGDDSVGISTLKTQ